MYFRGGVTHPDADIVFVLRPMENVFRGWVNCKVTRPDADIVFVLRPMENVFRGWVNCKVTRPDADIVSVLRPTENVTRPDADIVSVLRSTENVLRVWARSEFCLGLTDGANLLVQNMLPGMRWLKIACWVGQANHLRVGSCTKQSDLMTSCTSKGIPLALQWKRTPRLDSDV
nr:hypothetical protein [Tanacetum cinerariifolium]